jgi:hypothetical protein
MVSVKVMHCPGEFQRLHLCKFLFGAGFRSGFYCYVRFRAISVSCCQLVRGTCERIKCMCCLLMKGLIWQAELGTPPKGRPTHGGMMIKIECSPTAAPEFEVCSLTSLVIVT